MLKILLVEDSLLDAELIAGLLTEAGINTIIERVETQVEFVIALEKKTFDLILADYSLPAFDGISALEIARVTCPDIPFIFVSATLGEEIAIEMLKSGATDYVVKQRISRLVPCVERAIREANIRREQQQAETARKESEERFRSVADAAPVLIWMAGIDKSCNYFNKSWLEFRGRTLLEELGEGWTQGIHSDDREYCWNTYATAFDARQHFQMEYRLQRFDQEYRWVLDNGIPRFNPDGSFAGYIGSCIDITERKQAETAIQEANRRISNILESITDGFISVDTDWRFTYVNQRAEQLLGKSRADLMGQILWEAFAIAQNSPHIQQIYAAKASQVMLEYEEYMSLFNKWFTVRWYPSADGRTAYFQDITERKQTEKALKATEEKLRCLADANAIGILFGDIYGGIHDANDELLRMVGYSREQLYRGELRWLEITPPEYLSLDAERIAEAKKTGACTPYEKEYIRPDGSRISVFIGYALLGEKREESVAFVIDLTERKRLEKALQQRAEELAKANRLKDEFLATLSHELRTPLNAMLGWTQLLRSRNFDERRTARALETIDRNTRSLAALIEDLLDVSRIITGKLLLNLRSVDLPSIVEAAIETVLPAAEAKGIALIPNIDLAVGRISGDSGRLQQVVWNLLSNAIKFTPTGGRVDIKLQKLAGEKPHAISWAMISVQDTGKGISPEFLPYVFDRFSQADSTTTRSYSGLGLGLAIVRHLVELHGGTVQAHSEGENQGATFTVILPLHRGGRGMGELSNWDNGHAFWEPCDPGTPLPLKGIKVMVVDDEPDTREFLCAVLEDSGAHVILAASVSQALEALETLKPDVLVSDIAMPEQDGYSLIRQIRALSPEAGGQIPAAALTAYARAEDRMRALQAGFQIHLPKPIDPAELTTVVASLASRSPL